MASFGLLSISMVLHGQNTVSNIGGIFRVELSGLAEPLTIEGVGAGEFDLIG